MSVRIDTQRSIPTFGQRIAQARVRTAWHCILLVFVTTIARTLQGRNKLSQADLQDSGLQRLLRTNHPAQLALDQPPISDNISSAIPQHLNYPTKKGKYSSFTTSHLETVLSSG